MKKKVRYGLFNSSNSNPVAIRTNLQQEQLKKSTSTNVGCPTQNMWR